MAHIDIDIDIDQETVIGVDEMSNYPTIVLLCCVVLWLHLDGLHQDNKCVHIDSCRQIPIVGGQRVRTIAADVAAAVCDLTWLSKL